MIERLNSSWKSKSSELVAVNGYAMSTCGRLRKRIIFGGYTKVLQDLLCFLVRNLRRSQYKLSHLDHRSLRAINGRYLRIIPDSFVFSVRVGLILFLNPANQGVRIPLLACTQAGKTFTYVSSVCKMFVNFYDF